MFFSALLAFHWRGLTGLQQASAPTGPQSGAGGALAEVTVGPPPTDRYCSKRTNCCQQQQEAPMDRYAWLDLESEVHFSPPLSSADPG